MTRDRWCYRLKIEIESEYGELCSPIYSELRVDFQAIFIHVLYIFLTDLAKLDFMILN